MILFSPLFSRTCSQHTCLDMCSAATIFTDSATYLTPIQLNATSWKDANVEPACRLGYENLHDPSDTACLAGKVKIFKKIAWNQSHHRQWKFKLLAGKFTWVVKAKHCWGLSTNFWKQYVCCHHAAMFCLITSSKLSCQ